MLAKVAADASARRPIQMAPTLILTPGTVLLRAWHGTQHQVIVREYGVEFQGKRYKSLSQVAHRTTGIKWGHCSSGLGPIARSTPMDHANPRSPPLRDEGISVTLKIQVPCLQACR